MSFHPCAGLGNMCRAAAFLALLACSAYAATKEDYARETQRFLKESNEAPRSTKAVRDLLDKNIAGGFGRGQVVIVRPMITVGRELKDRDLLDKAKQIVLASNKVVVDGVDNPKKEIIGQVSFALYELVFAYKQLRTMGMLNPEELARTEKMLKGCADYWLKTRPTQGDGNLDMRYALGVASVANAFPEDPEAPRWRKWSELTFYNILRFPERNGIFQPEKGSLKCSLRKSGNAWKFLPDEQQPKPAFSPGIVENCNGYVGATVITWICLGEALGKHPEMTTPAVEAWLHTLYAQIMPNGILPPYGDSSWGSYEEWIGIFEWMGRAFHKPEYRMTAQGILDYGRQQKVMFKDTSEAIEFLDGSVPARAAPRGSELTWRQSTNGSRIPDKIILRGNGDAKSQPYVIVQALHGGGHSHPHGGAISAYTLGESVVLHDFGYDSTASVFHDMFLMRPAKESFLGFFGDPEKTPLAKINENNVRLTTLIPSPERLNTDADCVDFAKVSYGRVSYDCLTGWEKDKDFNGRAYTHTRELALEKDTGILVVFDTLQSHSDGELSAGPVWHAQKVLAEKGNGFLIQDENPAFIKPLLFTCPPHPVWVTMAGPKEHTKAERVTWHFEIRHGREEEMQSEHLVARYTGPMAAGRTLCFLTVFAPQPVGSTRIPDNIRAEVNGDNADASVGDWVFRFGAQKPIGPASRETSGPIRFSATHKKDGLHSYSVAVPAKGSGRKLEWESNL